MRVQGLGSSLVWGAVASLALISSQVVLAPVVGARPALEIHLALCLVAYAVLLGRSLRESVRNGLVAALGACVVLVLATRLGAGVGELAIGFSCVLAAVRSGFDPRFGRGRTLVVEAVLGTFALAFADWLASPGVLGSAFGLWGFSLVQGLFFMLPKSDAPGPRGSVGDPFERARSELLAMLDPS